MGVAGIVVIDHFLNVTWKVGEMLEGAQGSIRLMVSLREPVTYDDGA